MESGIWALVGTLAGGFVTYLAQIKIAEKEREARKKALSAAFYGEIYSLLHLAEQRNYIGYIKGVLAFIDKHRIYPVQDSFFQMQFQDYFAVYRNNIQHIGELDPDITPLITEFYIKAFSLMEDMTGLPGSIIKETALAYGDPNISKKVYVDSLERALKEDLTLAYNIIATGKIICEKLSDKYKLNYTPVFADLPKEA